MTLKEALDAYSAESGRQRARVVAAYLDYAGTLDTAREDRTFVRWLRAEADAHLKPATVDNHASCVRAFFRRFGMPAPRGKVAFDASRDSAKHVLDASTVRALLAALPRLRPYAAGALVMSTTYAMRAGELAATQDSDVDRAGQRIYIRTLKNGIQRWCWLPPEVAAWLPETWPRRTPGGMAAVWKAVWAEVLGTEPPKGVGWHAVRYAVILGLQQAGVPPAATTRFIRWRKGQKGEADDLGTLALYLQANTLVTAQGVEKMPEEDMGRRDADGEVWDRHPFTAAIPPPASR